MAHSRPYRITTKPPIGPTIAADDHIATQLDIPPILPPAPTAGIVRTVLGNRRFSQDSSGRMVRDRDGVKVTIDPNSLTVTVSAEGTASLPPPPPPSPCSCRAQASLSAAKHAADEAQRSLQQKVTELLSGAIGHLGCELEGVANKVTAEALKAKAAQMGDVKQITEDAKTGSMTILVEV